jgi:fatty-acyl-CoA synthase
MAEVCLAITFSPARHRVRTHDDAMDEPTTARQDPPLRAVRQGAAGIAWKCATSRQGAGDRESAASSSRAQHHAGLLRRAEPRARCLWTTVGSTPAISATRSTGEVVVTGRAKDLIIVNGRNIWPQDIEWAIETRRVVKNGDSVAFSVDRVRGRTRRRRPCWRASSGEEARQTLASDVAQARCARRSPSTATSCWCRRRWACRPTLVGQALALARQGQLPGRPLTRPRPPRADRSRR